MSKGKDKEDLKLPKQQRKKKQKIGGSGSSSHDHKGSNWNTAFAFIATLLVILFFVYQLLGGINQRKFVNTFAEFSQRVGETIAGWFTDHGTVEVNDDGVYIVPK